MLDGCTIREENGSTSISGTIGAFFYQVFLHEDSPVRCYPVSARLILRQGDTELKSAVWTTPEYDAKTGHYNTQCTVDWMVNVPQAELELVMEYTDNYGRVEERVISVDRIKTTVP